ncbi:MAG TPA: ribosome biogenesis GTPase Der, partial [Hyphomicrobiaceae bacterium]|nr:ribosome biogenesis GTPase Der [Hyphomicrobiaceae bacterium]
IDARAGVTPDDKAFARIVRTKSKPVVLVANKSEGRVGEAGALEGYELGLGEPVAVSAEHGEGIGDLAGDILDMLGLAAKATARRRRDDAGEADGDSEIDAERDGDIEPTRSRPIRVAIVGRPNAGKSTLVNALLGEERMISGPEPGLTRDSIPSDLTWKGRPIRLFDTAGLRRKARITERSEKLAASDAVRAIRFAEVVVLLLDAERPFEHQDLTIGGLVANEGRAIVVAVNKWDLVADKQKRLTELRAMLASTLAQVAGCRLVTVSALSERGIDKVMDAVLDAYEIWNKRVATPDLNRWLAEAVVRNSPPAVSGRRIRLRYITQPSARPPTFITFCSKPDDVPQSYIRYLTNSLRDVFGLPGTPIRFHLRKGDNPYDRS